MKEIIEEVLAKEDLMSENIPTLDLYMDQIITLFDTTLQQDKRYKEDKILTKTMINNYSKAKLITPVKGKKYTKEQILQMLVVYHLKNILSMQEIKTLTSPVYEKESCVQSIYDSFLEIKNAESPSILRTLEQGLDKYDLDIEKEEQRLLLALYLSSITTQITSIIEKILDKAE